MSDRYATYQRLKFDRPHARVLRITMTSPIKLNAMDPVLHNEASRIWADVDADPSVSVIIITGAGAAFSAGGDLAHEQKVQHDFGLRMDAMREARDLVLGMASCSKPIISAIRGWAVGAGLACGIMADISIASRTAKICDGHTKIGVVAGDHATIIWPLLCGMAKAKYYLLTSRTISGEEAERIGLVSLCVDDDKLLDKAYEVADKLASGSQTAIRWTKYSLNNWLRQAGPSFDTSLALEFMGFGGPDVREGVNAIKEKRPPHFG